MNSLDVRRAGPQVIATVSGKGGVGKTNLVANLAVAASGMGARVLLVDGDLGLANVDVLLGLVPPRSAADVIDGRCRLEEALLEGPRGIHVLPAASGRSDLSVLRPAGMAGLLVPLFALVPRYDLVLVDAGAGLGPAVISLAAASDRAILVLTEEPTCLADAYATLKVLSQEAEALPVQVLVNQARDARHARSVHQRLERVALRFLGSAPPFLGFVPRDLRLVQAVARQRAVVEAYPTASSSQRLIALAAELLRGPEGARTHPRAALPAARVQ